jgi:hypothetical protein
MKFQITFVSEIYSDNLVTVDVKKPHECGYKTFKLSDEQVSAFNSAEDVHAKLSIVFKGEEIEEELVD